MVTNITLDPEYTKLCEQLYELAQKYEYPELPNGARSLAVQLKQMLDGEPQPVLRQVMYVVGGKNAAGQEVAFITNSNSGDNAVAMAKARSNQPFQTFKNNASAKEIDHVILTETGYTLQHETKPTTGLWEVQFVRPTKGR